MNLTITTSGADTAAPLGAAPVLAASDPALLAQPALDAALDLAGALPFSLPLAQFGQLLEQATAAADGATDASAETQPADAAATREQPAAEQAPLAETVLMSAMSMPVMPLAQAAQATLAAVAAALPGAPASAKAEAAPVAASNGNAAAPTPAITALFDAPAQPAELSAPVAGAAPAAPAATALPRLDAAVADAAIAKPQAQAQNAAGAAFAPVLAEAAKEQAPGAGVERTVAAGASVAAPAAQAAAAADSVTLSGPPTAWRQNLREALGERLQLQVGRNAEQAVIRLDPPNLGQVEIAIRHSAGTLEVTISASHREVVRQLQAVSENLRSDLAQRQFTDVAVNVAPTRAGAQSGPMFGGDGQGRGRQDDQGDKAHPGQALAEAHQGAGEFSLNAG